MWMWATLVSWPTPPKNMGPLLMCSLRSLHVSHKPPLWGHTTFMGAVLPPFWEALFQTNLFSELNTCIKSTNNHTSDRTMFSACLQCKSWIVNMKTFIPGERKAHTVCLELHHFHNSYYESCSPFSSFRWLTCQISLSLEVWEECSITYILYSKTAEWFLFS